MEVEGSISNEDVGIEGIDVDTDLKQLLDNINNEIDKNEEECDFLLDLIVQEQYKLLSASKAFQVPKKHNGTTSDNWEGANVCD